MDLKIASNQFVENPQITVVVDDDLLLDADPRYFDKDGYELNHQERLFHRAAAVQIDQGHLFHTANHVSWFYDDDNDQQGLVLDHSTINMRWSYGGQAREQIVRLSNKCPSLNKLLGIKQKWGFDFSLDYVYDGGCLEVFHIEADYLSYQQAIDEKQKAEQLITTTDWQHGVKHLLAHKDSWSHLNSDDQADWKSKYFGWKRAFDNRKVFSFAT